MRWFPEHWDGSNAGAKCQTWLMGIVFIIGLSGRAEHSDKQHSKQRQISHHSTGCHRDSSGLVTPAATHPPSCSLTLLSAAWGQAGMNKSEKICGSDEAAVMSKKQRQRQAPVSQLPCLGCPVATSHRLWHLHDHLSDCPEPFSPSHRITKSQNWSGWKGQ